MKTEGTALTNDELFKKAVELTSIANQIGIIERLIENINYLKSKDDYVIIQFQVQSGMLDEIGDGLSGIKDSVQRISNEICPE